MKTTFVIGKNIGRVEVPFWGTGKLVVTPDMDHYQYKQIPSSIKRFTITHRLTGYSIDSLLDRFKPMGKTRLKKFASFLNKNFDWDFKKPEEAEIGRRAVIAGTIKWMKANNPE